MKIESIDGEKLTLGELAPGEVFKFSLGGIYYYIAGERTNPAAISRHITALDTGTVSNISVNSSVRRVKAKLVVEE